MRRFEARPGSRWAIPLLFVLWLLLGLAAVAGGNAVLGPAGYVVRLTADELVVDGFLGIFPEGRGVPREGLSAREVDARGMQRYAGTGRFDHCSGRWGHPSLGTVWLMSTCGEEAVLVEGASPPMVLGLAEPEAFMEALSSGASGSFSAPEAAAPGTWWRVLQGGLGLLVVIMVLLPLRLLRVMRELAYEVDGTELRVPGLLSHRVLGLQGARVERRSKPPRAGLVRVMGASLPGLHIGLYRGGGRWMHLAVTSLEDVVVVEGSEATVVVTPADPDAFLAALRSAGASV